MRVVETIKSAARRIRYLSLFVVCRYCLGNISASAFRTVSAEQSYCFDSDTSFPVYNES